MSNICIEKSLQTVLTACRATLTDHYGARLQKILLFGSSVRRNADADSDMIISDEDRRAVEEVRTEILTIRGGLREVQHDLRRDIDSLERLLKFLNIGAGPLVMGAGIVLMAFIRRRKRRAGMI